MADYNIYIHTVGGDGGSINEPTLPWSSREVSQPTAVESSGGSNVAKTLGYIANPDSIVASAVTGFTKAIPYVAVAMTVAMITSKVHNELSDIQIIQSG